MNIPSAFKEITGTEPVELYRTAHGWSLALLKKESEVRNLRPNFSNMKDSEFGDLIVTAPSSDPEFDFCVRCFAPALGIDEDPVNWLRSLCACTILEFENRENRFCLAPGIKKRRCFKSLTQRRKSGNFRPGKDHF